MPRFVILEHDWPHWHLDLMLEAGGALRTWRLAGWPQPGKVTAAQAISDHRLAYLEYEGSVSGGRGNVVRGDTGEFEWKVNEADRVVVAIVGHRFNGQLALERQPEKWIWFCRVEPVDAPGGCG